MEPLQTEEVKPQTEIKLQLTPVSQAEHRGTRGYQEDRHVLLTTQEGICLGVFDGHGGAECAHACSERFPLILVDLLGSGVSIPETLTQALKTLNKETKWLDSGTTASIAFIPWAANEVHTAVIGDSPVIVKQADQSIWVAPEHNVRTNQAEADAAESRGGTVYGGYLYAHSPYGDNPGLQMARALGDASLSSVLSRQPDSSTQPLGAGSWVLVASDGALDPSHANEAEGIKAIVEMVNTGADAQAVVSRALEIQTGDNVTCLLVRVE